MMSKVKKTEIYIRGFDMNFIITHHRDYFISLEQALAWVSSEVVPTAVVEKIVHKWEEGDLTINNEHFIPSSAKKTMNPYVYDYINGKLKFINSILQKDVVHDWSK
jgi:hypothetical protein